MRPAANAEDDLPQDAVSLGPGRPQQLLFSFLGALILDKGYPPISTRVFLQLLDDLGVQQAAARATLSRLVQKRFLHRAQKGRTARYNLTATGEAVLRDATPRVVSPTPFTHPDGEWTLLSYSIPESRRDLRQQIRSRLAWAGFGGLRDGLWIAPGRVDLSHVFAGENFVGVKALADAFLASPMPDTDMRAVLHRAWDVEKICARHQEFLTRWTADTGQHGRPLARITLLGADWVQLLRADPGLPAQYLPDNWPSERSAALYRDRFDALEPEATATLQRLLRSDEQRR